MKPISFLLLAVAVTSAEGTRQGEPLTARDFEFRAFIDVSQPGEYGAIRLDRHFYRHSKSRWGDLRVFPPGAGDAIPWVFRDVAEPRRTQPLALRILNRVRTAQGNLQFVADFGSEPVHYDSITLHLDGDEFRRSLRIESSQDGRQWDFVRAGAIMRFRQDGQTLEFLTIECPPSTRRFVRVTIENWAEPAALASVTARTAAVRPLEWEDLGECAPRLAPGENGQPPPASLKATQYDCEFPYGDIEGARLMVETTAAEFARNVYVASSVDGQSYVDNGAGTVLYRVPGAERLATTVGRIHGRHVRLRVMDLDNQPLRITRLRLEAPAREIVLPVRTAGRYRIYLGREATRRPSWDLADVLARRGKIAPVPLSVAAWERNPDFVAPAPPPKPFSERYPGLLTGVVILAALSMGYGAWRLMRKAS